METSPMVQPPAPTAESHQSLVQRHWRRRILLLVFGCGAGLLLAEFGLWIAGVNYPLFYQPDDYCGTVLAPHFSGWYTQEGCGYISTNSHGMRDREHALEKPRGTYRIAILGDSYAEALQVNREETFWSVLQDELLQSPAFRDRTVEVLNFGVSGYGTAQELQMLRTRVWQFDPDLILLAFVTGNDVRNNSKSLEDDKTRPFFVLDDDRLKLDTSFLEHPDQLKARLPATKTKVAWINRSRILQVINRWKNHSTTAHPPDGRTFNEAGLDIAVYRPPADAVWKTAWNVTEKLLQTLNEEAASHRAKFCVVTLSNGIQVHPDAAVRNQFMQHYDLTDLKYPDDRLEAFCRGEGIPVLTLVDPLQKLAEEQNVYWHGFDNTTLGTGHWNADGHRQAGKLIAEFLANDVIDSPR